MESLEGKRVVVTGGSAGIGLGIVEAFVAKKAEVFVVARDRGRLAEVKRRLGVATISADVTEDGVAAAVLGDARPDVLILNAGKAPVMAPLHEQTWEGFSAIWNHDVKAGLAWMQAALKMPLARGSRVLVSSSGAAVVGSPLSGGYAGAKRMLWIMARYANGASTELDLGISFQALVPMQMIAGTGTGGSGAAAYAKKKGVDLETFFAGFGKPLTPRQIGDYVIEVVTDARHESGFAFGIKGDTGIQRLEG